MRRAALAAAALAALAGAAPAQTPAPANPAGAECERLGGQLVGRSEAFEAYAAGFETRVGEIAAAVGQNQATPDQVEELTTLRREACANVSRTMLEMRRLYERLNNPTCLAADEDIAQVPQAPERMREAAAGTCGSTSPPPR